MNEYGKSIVESYQAIQREHNKRFSDVIDKMIHGGGATRISYRKWWNPVRWFKGEMKVEYISAERMMKK